MQEKTRELFLQSIVVLGSIFVVGAARAAPNFIQVSTSGGVLIVNQNNGSINYCSGLLNGNTNAPLGKCAVIGSISAINLAGNVQINIGTNANAVAFITNTLTGAIVQCGLLVNGNTGIPLGGCVTLQAQ